MDAEPINPERMQFLLWTLYAELEPGRILALNHQDLERLALWIAEFLSARLARLRYDSAVQTFLTAPHTYGWDVKRKLVWLGQHSYLFRLPCAVYIQDHGGTADIPTLDDFLCQETTHWSGLGVIDILAATVDMTDDQRRDLRRWSIAIVPRSLRKHANISGSIISNLSTISGLTWSPTRMARRWLRRCSSFITISLRQHPKPRWKPCCNVIICLHPPPR